MAFVTRKGLQVSDQAATGSAGQALEQNTRVVGDRLETLEAGSGTDDDAIHDNVAAEISAITEKTTPVSADVIIIEDSAAANAKKKVQIGNLPSGGTDPDAIHDNVAAEISAIAEKTTPVSADLIIIEDSAAANAKKRVQVGNLPGGGTDPDAIHDNVSGEITAITEKVAPIAADVLVIEDSAAAGVKKKVQIGNLPTGADPDAIHDNVSGEIAAITEKTTPVSADLIVIEDSAATNTKKKVQIGNLPGGAGGFFSDGAGTNAAVGKGATPPTAAGANAFAQGDGSVASQVQSFASGRGAQATGVDAVAFGFNSFAQGAYSFALGYFNYAKGMASFAMGNSTYAQTLSFALGYFCQTTGIRSFGHGYQVYVQGQASFGQGEVHNTNSYADYSFGQGSNLIIWSARQFNQGKGNTMRTGSEDSFAQGSEHLIGYNAPAAFVQGYGCQVDAARGFAQGNRAKGYLADQKSWGSNRAALGQAQFSHMTKHVQTTDDTVTTLANIALDQDRSQVISAQVVARNTTTDGETASFHLAQATVYRDTAGAAVLVGSPTFTKESTGQDPGPGNAAFTCVIVASGNSILIQVTGEPVVQGQTYEWCATVFFTNVAG